MFDYFSGVVQKYVFSEFNNSLKIGAGACRVIMRFNHGGEYSAVFTDLISVSVCLDPPFYVTFFGLGCPDVLAPMFPDCTRCVATCMGHGILPLK
jgi:hypothetical protein